MNEDDFPEIERRMRKILKRGQRFYREELGAEDALARIAEMGEPYKREYAEELLARADLDGLSFYRNGPFLDMCEGPHVDTTRDIPRDAFKLRNLAGAYWRGDSDNVMMTRIYAWAFENREELDAHVSAWELAQERDHKKLGRELDLFHLDERVGRGLPLWLPNGAVLREELEKLAKELEFRADYHRVATPHLAKADLYRQSGHLPYYQDDMFPLMELKETREEDAEGVAGEAIKEGLRAQAHELPAPPQHLRGPPTQLPRAAATPGRVRARLPLRGVRRGQRVAARAGHVHERRAHLLHRGADPLRVQGRDADVRGGVRHFRAVGLWRPAIALGSGTTGSGARSTSTIPRPGSIRRASSRRCSGTWASTTWTAPGEAAFYGPKIDILCRTVTGREEQLGTVQLDFAQPERLGLVYVGADGAEHTPYCIHRAPLSTHERMAAFLIEHFGGAFPTWLAPVQVRVITVSDQFDAYGQSVVDRLRGRFVRAEMASRSDTVGKKIREGTTRKIPNLLVVGEREQADGTVTLRRYGVKRQQTLPVEEFEAWIVDQIASRALPES